MHARKYLASFAAGAAVLLTWRAGPSAAPGRPAGGVAAGVGHFQGVGGCSARACHGGLVPDDPTTDRSRYAYTFSLNFDKHPRAFAVLDQDLGRHIMKNLAHGGPVKLGSEDARCLACHTVPGTVLDAAGELNLSDAARALRREGVGCEACHGASESWLVAHTAWRTPREREAGYRSSGMTPLDDLATRAGVCVGCHVGAPEDKGHHLPARDVNHELIAAGHPRLSFEFASYLADLPPHWNEPADRERPARAWVVGQAVQAEAELKLLQPPAAGPETWPEFARYDCAACHHDLSAGTWRRGPGHLVGDGWDVSLPLRRMTAGDAELGKALDRLKETLGQPGGWRPEIGTRAKEAADRLVEWRAKNQDKPNAALRGALALLKDAGGQRLSWDDAAQCYLALSAWQRSRPAADPAFGEKLTKLRTELQKLLPRSPERFDTPRGYRPADVQTLLREFSGLLTAE